MVNGLLLNIFLAHDDSIAMAMPSATLIALYYAAAHRHPSSRERQSAMRKDDIRVGCHPGWRMQGRSLHGSCSRVRRIARADETSRQPGPGTACSRCWCLRTRAWRRKPFAAQRITAQRITTSTCQKQHTCSTPPTIPRTPPPHLDPEECFITTNTNNQRGEKPLVTRRSICVRSRHVPHTQPSSVSRGTLTTFPQPERGWWSTTSRENTTSCRLACVNSTEGRLPKFSMPIICKHRFYG
jgi:hypothetical protein